ncbi:MAG: ATP synthase F0 subunit A [Candidatus Rokuibacteriota bacterium]|nr:MAG: ATP synthase F0 subunit A [Candidatus Rokubacteria bacterium]PYN55609.1 MAG: ATP synthase F0 subunit A [Candidatus Rokubacteria bacterium]
MVILAGVAFAASRNVRLVPRGLQNFLEVVLEQFIQMIDDVMGVEGRRYLPLLATLGLFIVTANLISLVPGMGGPTSNLNTNAACALVVFVSYHWIGVRKQGALKYLAHFAGPVPLALKPLMFVIEIISHLARPLSLTLRLFGNMVGGHILLAVIFLLMGLDGLIGWALSGSAAGAIVGGIGGAVTVVFTVGFLYPLKILVAFLQAFIFVMLTMLYISGAIEESEHHAEHQSEHHH